MKTSIWIATVPLILVVAAPGETLYTVTPIGALPGATYTVATAINDLGQVTGASGGGAGQTQALLYSNDVITNLGGLPGFPKIPERGSTAQARLPGMASMATLTTLPARHLFIAVARSPKSVQSRD
jgi:probable HAF family extracellular repeat protein